MDSSLRFPPDTQSNLWKCTETFVSTEHGKRYRFRFLPLTRISDQDQRTIKDFLNSFKHLYTLTLKSQKEVVLNLTKDLQEMIEASSRLYDR